MSILNSQNKAQTKLSLKSALAIFALCTVTSIAPANADELVSPKETAKMLSEGGYVIYIRHASTEKDYADQLTADVNNCSTQRTLSEKGWDEATLMGSSFDVLKIPVGSIYSSEYCRAWQTARIAFGQSVKLPALNFEKGEEYTEAQTEAMRNNVEPLLSQVPLSGSNTVIVGHDDPFEAATGIYPEPQGVAYIVKPLDEGKFKIVGAIKPTDWPNLVAGH